MAEGSCDDSGEGRAVGQPASSTRRWRI